MDILAHCAAAFSQHGGVFALFFIGGLTGGFTHCLGMCGPLVASEILACHGKCAGGCSVRSELGRASGMAYHLGRITTYGALGFLAALLAKQVAAFSFWPLLSAGMLVAAGLMFLASSVMHCRHSALSSSPKLTYMRGFLLGFMPCGLLYAALMMAATLANPFSGMIAMWLFTLGTIPALLIASGGAALLNRKWNHAMQTMGRVMMAFNGLSLLVMAARTMR